MLLEICGIGLRIGPVAILNEVEASIDDGERVGLIGPNGAGKTTLMNVICGRIRPTRGAVKFQNADITRASAEARVRSGLIRTFQINQTIPELSVLENVRLAVLAQSGYALSLRPHGRVANDAEGIARQFVDAVGLTTASCLPVKQLSYGKQRLLEVATALALKPRMLLLDEPLAGVSQADAILVGEVIKKLPQSTGILLIEHDIDFLLRSVERVLVMVDGHIIFNGSPDDVKKDHTVQRAYLGTDEMEVER